MNTQNQEPVAYKCKYCHKPGVAYYDPNCDNLRLECWTAMLSCNRCADFHTKRVKLTESIWSTCYSLAVIIEGTHDKSVHGEALSRAREKLNLKTKAFAAHICTFFNKITVWEPDFTQMLLDAPRKCHDTLHHYHRGISGIR